MFNGSGDDGMLSFPLGDPQVVTAGPTMGLAGSHGAGERFTSFNLSLTKYSFPSHVVRRIQMARRGRGGLSYTPVPHGETVYANFERGEPAVAETEAGGTQQFQAPPGSLLEVKRIDETYDMRNGVWSTRDSVTPTSEKKDKDTYAAYVFTVNRRFQPTDNKGMHIVTTVLDVKSEHLREVGKSVIGQVQGISWTSRPLKVSISLTS